MYFKEQVIHINRKIYLINDLKKHRQMWAEATDIVATAGFFFFSVYRKNLHENTFRWNRCELMK